MASGRFQRTSRKGSRWTVGKSVGRPYRVGVVNVVTVFSSFADLWPCMECHLPSTQREHRCASPLRQACNTPCGVALAATGWHARRCTAQQRHDRWPVNSRAWRRGWARPAHERCRGWHERCYGQKRWRDGFKGWSGHGQWKFVVRFWDTSCESRCKAQHRWAKDEFMINISDQILIR